MAKIEAFRGVRFNEKKTGTIANIVCPPYDVINKQQRIGYMKQSEYNAVHIELPEGKTNTDKHKNARRLIDKWLKNNILIWDERPSIYIYAEEFKIGKAAKRRLGFISLLEIEGEKKILPHEKIFNKFKLERFDLMRQTQAHISPIFCIFDDKNKKIENLVTGIINNKKQVADILVNNIREKLWKIDDEKFINSIKNFMKDKKAFIADGHHRFQASSHLRDYMRQKYGASGGKQPYDYTLCYFVSMQDRGLTILPAHRAIKHIPQGLMKGLLVKRLSEYFIIQTAKDKIDTAAKMENAFKRNEHAFGFFFESKYIVAVLKDKNIIKDIGTIESPAWKKLDIAILHHFVLPKLLKIKEKSKGERNIYYYRGKTEAIKRVKAGEFKMAIFLNPTKIEEIPKVAVAGNKMPHKSTYFYPKPLTGLVIHKF